MDIWKKIGGKEVGIDFLPGVLEWRRFNRIVNDKMETYSYFMFLFELMERSSLEIVAHFLVT